jgi:hypothetical protein
VALAELRSFDPTLAGRPPVVTFRSVRPARPDRLRPQSAGSHGRSRRHVPTHELDNRAAGLPIENGSASARRIDGNTPAQHESFAVLVPQDGGILKRVAVQEQQVCAGTDRDPAEIVAAEQAGIPRGR